VATIICVRAANECAAGAQYEVSSSSLLSFSLCARVIIPQLLNNNGADESLFKAVITRPEKNKLPGKELQQVQMASMSLLERFNSDGRAIDSEKRARGVGPASINL
jgi:hypothetical protein